MLNTLQIPTKLTLKVSQKVALIPNIFKIRFESDSILNFLPGQFVTLIINNLTRRSYSVGSISGQNFIETYVDITPGGPGSKFFENVQIGETVEAIFPLGKFVYAESEYPAIFVATGTGITPFVSMIETALKVNNSKREIKLIWGAKTEADLFLKNEIMELKNNFPNFDFTFCVSREEATEYSKGRVTNVIESAQFSTDSEFYICGGKVMIEDVDKLLTVKGFAKEKIKYEQFY